MAAAPAAGGGRAGSLPRLSIGLLQSEAEMLHVPGQDWTSMFTDPPDEWRVDVAVTGTHSELVDPYRTGLPGGSACSP